MKRYILLFGLWMVTVHGVLAQHLHNSTTIVITSGTTMIVNMSFNQDEAGAEKGHLRNDGNLFISSNLTQEDGARIENNAFLTVQGDFKQSFSNTTLQNANFLTVGGDFESTILADVQNTAKIEVGGNLTLSEGTSNNSGSWTVEGNLLHDETEKFTNTGLFSVNDITQDNEATLDNSGFITVRGSITQKNEASISLAGTIFISGSWTNNSKNEALTGVGTVQFIGSGTSTISGNKELTFYELEVNKPDTIIIVNSTVNIANNLDFISGKIDFQKTGTLLKTAIITNEREEHFALGKLTYTATTIDNSSENFGGLGIIILALNQNLGKTTLIRETGMGASQSYLSKSNIWRTWDIKPDKQPKEPVQVSVDWLKGDEQRQPFEELQAWIDDGTGWVGFSTAGMFPKQHHDFPADKLHKFTIGGVGLLVASGVVTELGYGLPDVEIVVETIRPDFTTVTYTTRTDENGIYTAFVSSGLTGSLTLAKTGEFMSAYVFTSVGFLTAGTPFQTVYRHPENNFEAFSAYSIDGRVTNFGRGVHLTTINIQDENAQTVFTTATNTNGFYTAFVTSGLVGKVIPAKEGYVFTPPQISFKNKLKNLSNKDFTGSTTHPLQGKITEAGTPLISATLTLSNDFITITDNNGFYTAFVSSGFTGTIAPSKENYIFTTQGRSFQTVLDPFFDQDFSASTRYRVEGQITEGDTIQADVKITVSDGQDYQFMTVSDNNGFYTAFVSSGFRGTVQANKFGYFYKPYKYDFTSVLKHQTNTNFEVGTYQEITGQIKILGTENPLEGVALQAEGDTAIYTSNEYGFYTAFVTPGFTGGLQAQKEGFVFDPSSQPFISVVSDEKNKDFTAVRLMAIQGQLIAGDTAVSGASIYLSDIGSVLTDTNGFYTAFVSSGYSGTIVPQKKYHLFTPETLSFISILHDTICNFEGRLENYAIQGQILLDDNIPLAGIEVAVGDSTGVTDTNGFYTVYQYAGYAGHITPDSTLNCFEPRSLELPRIFVTSTGNDFRAYSAPISLDNDQRTIREKGANVYCSRVTLSVNLDSISPHLHDSVEYVWSNNSFKSALGINASGSYSVKVKIPNYYETTLSQMVKMSENKLVVDWGEDSIICIGATAILEAPQGQNINRIWRQKQGNDFIEMPSVNAINQDVPAGIYQLELANEICDVIYEINIEEAPKQIFDSLKPTYYFCNEEEPALLQAENIHTANYKWIGAEGFSSQDPIIQVSVGGEYKLIATDKHGCTEELTVNVIDNQRLENRFLFQSEVRVGDTVVFVNISRKLEGSEVEPTQALWNFGDLESASDYEQSEFIFDKEGEYAISLAVSNENCTTQHTKTLKVVPMPQGGRTERVLPNQEWDYMIQKVLLYPNPVQDVFQLKAYNLLEENTTIQVYNNYGQQIVKKQIDISQPYFLDVSNLTIGVYFIKVINGGFVRTLRFVKM